MHTATLTAKRKPVTFDLTKISTEKLKLKLPIRSLNASAKILAQRYGN
jgi:hypothetical protein